MSRMNEIKNLIDSKSRHLQKLKEQQATMGILTPPYISIEMEDIESDISKLKIELEDFQEGSSDERLSYFWEGHLWKELQQRDSLEAKPIKEFLNQCASQILKMKVQRDIASNWQ